ncbi:MAG: cellulase family glycosylhydrolase [Clostridia bacterium]|nr:cellulase family glycosylhydrolase [Clostridia bacterium]
MNYGLTVKDGVLQLDGKTFYGIGTNSFISFVAQMYGDDEKSKRLKGVYLEDIPLMQELGIPFMRIPLCTWGEHGFLSWMKDKEAYFKEMDKIVKECEKCHIGIIASLLWRFCTMSNIVNEPLRLMRDPESKQTKLSVEYVEDVVKRYVNSPAIWGWEIGNEYNLDADWGPAHFAPNEQWVFKTEDFEAFYKTIGDTIRKYDKYRMITSGNGEQRNCALHLNRSSSYENTWTPDDIDFTADTLEEFETMMLRQNADPIDTVCTHFQHGNKYNLLDGFAPYPGAKAVPISVKDFLKLHVDTAKKHGKALYFGECGDMMQWHELGRHYLDNYPLLLTNFYIVMQSIMDAGVQLASAWMEGTVEGIKYCVVDDQGGGQGNKYGYFKLLEFKRMNVYYRTHGMQETEEYWKKAGV